jgi:hypothetical protein
VDTHRFTLNARTVLARRAAIVSSSPAGSRCCAPNDPSPPAFDTAAASSTDDNPPPNGPWTIGCSRPKFSKIGFTVPTLRGAITVGNQLPVATW